MKLYILLACVLLGGCATVTTGTIQSVYIDSEPRKAECTITKGNDEIAHVTTPSSVMLEKGALGLAVVCTKEGYVPTGGFINSNYNPATLGNILLGGVVGIVIDAASGAQSIYDKSIKVILKKVADKNIDKEINDIIKNSK